MRKLEFEINLEHFRSIKPEIVPILFTEHQFHLLEKKAKNQRLTPSEKNEFSRSISKKMKAINKILRKERFFVYGKEKMLSERLKLAEKYLWKFSRKFKNKLVIISGSFLYAQKYGDIDVFVVEKYEKEDYKEGKFQFNYLSENVYYSLFFSGLKKLCISNKRIAEEGIKEKINLDTFISLYQEVFNDLDRNPKAAKETLRNYLMQAAFLKKAPVFDSLELKEQVEAILKLKKPEEVIKNIFVETAVVGIKPKQSLKTMREMLSSYYDLIKEYPQHKDYYTKLAGAFQEVIKIAS